MRPFSTGGEVPASQLSVKTEKLTRLVKIDSCINKTPEGMKDWQHEAEQASGLFGR